MSQEPLANLVGRSAAFVQAVRLVERIAQTDAPVLIEGETGTGKELAARAIHYGGSRRHEPFVPVNCAAIPESLIENELFGHVRGAYTDARAAQPGLVALASGGTLFLDEVEALAPKGQGALLRFLQDQKFRALGSTVEQAANVRIIAASNRSLVALAEQGLFRLDLLFRLKVLYLELPALRDRHGDVALLAAHFIATCSARYRLPRKRLDPASMPLLEAYSWPGNVRELENVLHRGFLLADGEVVTVMAPELRPAERLVCAGDNYQAAKAEALRSFNRRFLTGLLSRTGGNVSAAAAQAGKERRALGKLLKKYGVDPQSFRNGQG